MSQTEIDIKQKSSELRIEDLGRREPILTCLPLLDWMARDYALHVFSDAQEQSFLRPRLPMNRTPGKFCRHGYTYGEYMEDIPVGTLMAINHAWMLYGILKDFLELIDLKSTDREIGMRTFEINDYGKIVAGGIIPKEMVDLANKPSDARWSSLERFFPELYKTKKAALDLPYQERRKLELKEKT